PDRFMLLQNYPNPFNAQTTIRFVLPQSQNVQLTIYDLLGRRVEVIIDEYMQAGVHTVTFDASKLSSSVYLYRLEAGDVIDTKRMVLLK
ncbi:MAG: T9SS type A sorting domain-containing protein, partial [Candidatus Zixiibacteriota bacterium]